MFNSSAAKEVPSDPFLSEDPFKSDTFKGLYFFFLLLHPTLGTTRWIYHCFQEMHLWLVLCLVHFQDPFGDPFKQKDPFKGTSSEDFFKKTDNTDLLASSEPFGRKPSLPAKVLNTDYLLLSE